MNITRYNFSSRAVIRQDPSLRIDQIKLPYTALVIMLKAQIENILHRMYNISYNDAYNIWYKAVSTIDKTVVNIIEMLIKQSCPDPITGEPQGLPMILNRNPTISYGSILQMFCIGINLHDYTTSVPLQILPLLAADFDGDVLNLMFIINDAFYQRAYEIFNPRNAMYISRSNGLLNKSVMVQRDTLINANTLCRLGGDRKYSKAEIEHIKQIKEKMKL